MTTGWAKIKDHIAFMINTQTELKGSQKGTGQTMSKLRAYCGIVVDIQIG